MNRIFSLVLTSIITLAASAQQTVIDRILTDLANESMVIIRQDYQLIDDDDNVKNTNDKDYWKRTYALGLRVGENMYMVSDETTKPWSKEALSKNDRYQPAISSTASRPINAIEFDEIDYDGDELTEIQENRIFLFEGSEQPGVSVLTPAGNQQVCLVIAEIPDPISETNETAKVNIKILTNSFNFSSSKTKYDLKEEIPNAAIGGFAFMPVVIHPGLVDFCVVGMLQKVGGIWKLIPVAEGTEIHRMDVSGDYNIDLSLSQVYNGMATGIESFLDEIGVPR